MKVPYISGIDKVSQISDQEKKRLKPITDQYIFRTNEYYNSLIDWTDPDDPIKKIILPDVSELNEWGDLDASSEKLYQPVAGLEHKYQNTALLLCSDVCAAYCRFCFRKRLFQADNDEAVMDVSLGIQYIKSHSEIDNVLLTGGDPLILSTNNLDKIISQLIAIEHVRIIRIGTKIPAFNPFRILNDETISDLIRKYSANKQFYLMVHFNHPRELTEPAIKSLRMLKTAGATVVNQTPIIRGVNDNAEALGQLVRSLAHIGISQYYVFHCRPTAGNLMYSMPVERAFEIFREATSGISGLSKTSRFMISHRIGKIEVLGLDKDFIFMKMHHLAVGQSGDNQVMVFKRNPEAYWFDDYQDSKVEILTPTTTA